jgi:thiamine-monophosphate kinase
MKASDEFSMIRSFVEGWGDLASGIGDDAAVLEIPAGEKLVVSTDASVENVHFRRSDLSAEEIGYRAAASALSDLAAMASHPRGLLFALVLPAAWRDDARSLADGVGRAARVTGCPVIGGNISVGDELSITTTVLGSSRCPLTRSGARVGDRVYVTADLGGAADAVEAWKHGRTPTESSRRKFANPVPRIAEALWLAGRGATSAIDISDGLAADARHLAQASRVRFTIEADNVPLGEGVTLMQALAGGDDYELLVTAPQLDASAFAKRFGIPLTQIGSVGEASGRDEGELEILHHGARIPAPRGYDHLAAR